MRTRHCSAWSQEVPSPSNHAVEFGRSGDRSGSDHGAQADGVIPSARNATASMGHVDDRVRYLAATRATIDAKRRAKALARQTPRAGLGPAVSSRGWRATSRSHETVCTNAGARLRSPATTATRRACRSPRSPNAWDVRKPPSRRTCTTRQGKRHARSSAAIRAGAAGAGRRPSRPTARADPYQHCERCHPGAAARKLTREQVRTAMRAWLERYGSPPSSADWSLTHAHRRGGDVLERLEDGDPVSSTVIELYDSWAAARADAFPNG